MAYSAGLCSSSRIAKLGFGTVPWPVQPVPTIIEQVVVEIELVALCAAAAPDLSRMVFWPTSPCIAVSLTDDKADCSWGLRVRKPANSLEHMLCNHVRLHHQKIDAGLFSQQQVASWLGQLLLGLEHLHACNVILGNLTLANVSIDARGLATIALSSQEHGTRNERCKQSVGYAAPEVLLGKPFGPPADLFSLGVIAWVLLTVGGFDKETPGPPRSQTMTDDSAGLCYWRLLRQCIVDPASSSVQFAPDAKDLLYRLTELQPQNRPTHNGVRHSAFLAPLLLPDACEEEGIVETWLGTQAVEHDLLSISDEDTQSPSDKI